MSRSGEGEYVPSPRPNPRLRPEGAAYAERNRGTMERWFDYSDTISDKRGGGGGGGGAGGDNHEVVAAASDGALDDDVGEGALGSRGGGEEGPGGATESQADLTEKYSQLSLSSNRGASEEAKEYAQRNRGTMDHIINNYGVASSTSLPDQEVASSVTMSQSTDTILPSSPAPDSARRSLHMESQGLTWDEARPVPRIRAEGEGIALKNSHDSMFGIMNSEANPETSPVKKPHSSRQNEESQENSQSANQPRARPGEGRKNYERAHDQSEMNAIMRGEGNDKSANLPRKSQHLQRSELW